VLATDLPLDPARCRRLAMLGSDGLARAVNPAHTVLDGDVVFAASTAPAPPVGAPLPPPLDPSRWHDVLGVAADVVTRAVVRGVLAAETVTTPAGTWRSYCDLAPSALG
jgi:putative pantetheine hydrolase